MDHDKKTVLKTILKNTDYYPHFTNYFDDKINENLKIFVKSKKKITPKVARNFFDIDDIELNTLEEDLFRIEFEQEQINQFKIQSLNCESWTDFDDLKTKCFVQIDKESEITSFSSFEDIPQIHEEYKAMVNETILTGFPELDKILNDNGGWMRGACYSVLGLAGIGKSIHLVNYGRASFEQGYKILYISTEMTRLEIIERLVKSLTNKKTFDEATITMVTNKMKYSGRFDVMKINPYELTVNDIRNKIEKLDFDPDVLIIDYADEILPDKKTTSEYDAQGMVYAGLKSLANDFNIPVITATQANRKAAGENGGTNEYVGMADIADSSKKVRLVDCLLAISQTPEDREENKIYLTVLKNRKSTTGNRIGFEIDYERMRIADFKMNLNQTEKMQEKEESKTEKKSKSENKPSSGENVITVEKGKKLGRKK